MMCKGCKKKPSEIQEYVYMGIVEDVTPEQFVAQDEGTYNPMTGKFYCSECYIKAGMPLGKA